MRQPAERQPEFPGVGCRSSHIRELHCSKTAAYAQAFERPPVNCINQGRYGNGKAEFRRRKSRVPKTLHICKAAFRTISPAA